MNLTELIHHPERLDRETLFDLRNIIALHPYYQTARLLMLQNLYLLHDPTFGEELRSAAIYITDRKVLFNLFEAAHYKIIPQNDALQDTNKDKVLPNRTTELIDSFLESIPEEEEEEKPQKQKRKPTPADAAVDYVAYLMECGNQSEESSTPQSRQTGNRTSEIIDSFLGDGGRFTLPEVIEEYPLQVSQNENSADDTNDDKKQQNLPDEGIFTETMARIYIKQGRYSQALKIIKRLNLDNPKKNCYFADQIRFLEKLIVNNNKK